MDKRDYKLNPTLVKLMEDEVNSIYHCKYRPNEKVCDIYPRFKILARTYAYNLQEILNN